MLVLKPTKRWVQFFIRVVRIDAEPKKKATEEERKKIVFTVAGNVAIMEEGKKVTNIMTHIHKVAQIWVFCTLSKSDLTSSHRHTVRGLCAILHIRTLTFSSVNGSHHLNTSQVIFWISHGSLAIKLH